VKFDPSAKVNRDTYLAWKKEWLEHNADLSSAITAAYFQGGKEYGDWFHGVIEEMEALDQQPV
jgi:hypothetical protein